MKIGILVLIFVQFGCSGEAHLLAGKNSNSSDSSRSEVASGEALEEVPKDEDKKKNIHEANSNAKNKVSGTENVRSFGLELFGLPVLRCKLVKVNGIFLNAEYPNGGGCSTTYFQYAGVDTSLSRLEKEKADLKLGIRRPGDQLSEEERASAIDGAIKSKNILVKQNQDLVQSFSITLAASDCPYKDDLQNFDDYFADDDDLTQVESKIGCLGDVEISDSYFGTH